MSTALTTLEQELMQVEVHDPAERRHTITLTADQLDAIAEAAADKAVSKITDNVYKQVGKGILNKLIWLLGAFGTGVYLWMASKGLVKFP